MDWKKTLFVVVLTGMVPFAMLGCGQTEESTPTTEQSTPTTEQPAPAAEQPSPAVEQTTPAPGGTMPTPPEGGVPGERPSSPAMDLAAAAEKLGVTEEQLSEALGDLEQGFPDLAAAAEKLGVSEESLREALGLPASGSPPDGPPPGGSEPAEQEQ
jgi:hypothetical protein